MRKLSVSLGALVLGGFGTGLVVAETKVPVSSLAQGLEWVGVAVEEPDFTLWGASPIEDEAGRVHLLVARWPEPNVDPAWRRSSEIAHYEAPAPEGPFHFREVALRGTGRETWDRYAPHNPEIRRFGDRYVLLYIANDDYRQPPHPANQRIGMAVARSPAGPWEKVNGDGLILSSSPDPAHWSHGSQVVNPTLLEVDGRFHLYFKARCQGVPGTVYGLATADRLEGPYRLAGEPLTRKGVMIEDGSAFAWDDKVCLLSTDNHGSVTGVRGGGILWVSADGRTFDPAWTQTGFDRIPGLYANYRPERVTRVYGGDPKFERPKILMRAGRPAYLYAPSGWNVTGGARTVVHVLRVRLGPDDGPLTGLGGR
ncbi:MAG: hypothetical protein H7A45_01645 [Verrucomicrobiales bacterium]|nr:hypothetical protein [Verrucomicrobiales bacterium]